ncbi:MAG: hypothetical protein QM564_06740 [Bergeyella sp.]
MKSKTKKKNRLLIIALVIILTGIFISFTPLVGFYAIDPARLWFCILILLWAIAEKYNTHNEKNKT